MRRCRCYNDVTNREPLPTRARVISKLFHKDARNRLSDSRTAFQTHVLLFIFIYLISWPTALKQVKVQHQRIQCCSEIWRASWWIKSTAIGMTCFCSGYSQCIKNYSNLFRYSVNFMNFYCGLSSRRQPSNMPNVKFIWWITDISS
jgi:hypothetical protein